MEVQGVVDASETSNSQSSGLDELYKATLSETDQVYELPFPIQTVECYTTNVGDQYEADESNSVLDLDKGQIQVIKVQPNYTTCDSQILQQYLNEAAILRSDGSAYEQIVIVPKQPPPKMNDFEFNSSDSFSSTESIIPKNHKCPKCPKRFMFKSDLTRHDKHKHSIKQKLKCCVCKKEFFSQQNLLFHEKSHKPSVNLKCPVCNKLCRTQMDYNQHVVKHKTFNIESECEKCGATCTGQQAIEVHSQTHSKQAHICEKCGTISRILSDHKSHVLNHKTVSETESTEMFKCAVCPARYYQKFNYDLHMQGHKNSRSCNIGDSVFGTKNNNRKKISCPHCLKEFTKWSLQRHIRKVHKTPMQESCTQTGHDLITSYEISDMVVHPTITAIDGNQSIILTPVTNLSEVTTLNSVPILISRPANVPFSSS